MKRFPIALLLLAAACGEGAGDPTSTTGETAPTAAVVDAGNEDLWCQGHAYFVAAPVVQAAIDDESGLESPLPERVQNLLNMESDSEQVVRIWKEDDPTQWRDLCSASYEAASSLGDAEWVWCLEEPDRVGRAGELLGLLETLPDSVQTDVNEWLGVSNDTAYVLAELGMQRHDQEGWARSCQAAFDSR
jgi:hypothetical protein